jgi:hypothetical protein
MQISSIYKAEKGLIKITADFEQQEIKEISITGDFFMIPEEAIVILERNLKGKPLETNAIAKVVEDFYSLGIITPSVEKEDFIKAIMSIKALE